MTQCSIVAVVVVSALLCGLCGKIVARGVPAGGGRGGRGGAMVCDSTTKSKDLMFSSSVRGLRDSLRTLRLETVVAVVCTQPKNTQCTTPASSLPSAKILSQDRTFPISAEADQGISPFPSY